MKDITLLMTGVGGPGALGYIYSLQKNGERSIRFIGTDISDQVDPATRQQLAAFFRIPRAGTDAYLPALLTLCRAQSVDVLLPLNTVELDCLSMHRRQFEAFGTRICVPDWEQLMVINNKSKLLAKLKTLGIKTPAFYSVGTVPDFEAASKALGFPQRPIVVKRPDGNGSRGLRFLDASVSNAALFLDQKPRSAYISYTAMLEMLPEVFERTSLIVMEMLSGQEYSVDSFADHGRTVRSVCRHVDVIEDSNDVDATIDQQADVLQYCGRINAALRLDGVIGYGIKRNAEGLPRILEINPRLQATTILSVIGGVNYPYAIVKKALGEPVELPEPMEGIRTLQRKQRLFYAPDGQLLLSL